MRASEIIGDLLLDGSSNTGTVKPIKPVKPVKPMTPAQSRTKAKRKTIAIAKVQDVAASNAKKMNAAKAKVFDA